MIRAGLLISCAFMYGLLSAQTASNTMGIRDIPEELSLKNVLEEIESTKHVHFLYEANLVKDKFVESRPDYAVALHTILEDLLADFSLAFERIDRENYVLLSTGEPEPDLVVLQQAPQVIVVRRYSGTVTDAATNEPLIGVSVVVAGHSNLGTITDAEGAFSLEVPDDADKLILSYIGYETVEVQLGSEMHLTIRMEIRVNQLVAMIGGADMV